MNLGAPELLFLFIIPLWLAGIIWWIVSIVEVANVPAPVYVATGRER